MPVPPARTPCSVSARHRATTARAAAGAADAAVSPVRLRAWRDGDLGLLTRLLGDPAGTAYIGGPESPEKLASRHERYLAAAPPEGVFAITVGADGTPAGWVGYWKTERHGEPVWEMGWAVLPEYQGLGVATAATRLALSRAAETGVHRWVHAFPSVENRASNALCRTVGFECLGETEVEYPPGHTMRSNDWRFDLTTLGAARVEGSRCPECGAPVDVGGSCRDAFHALLALEATVPGAPGGLPHFYAVACYGIQHPDSMGFVASTVLGLRESVALAVSGSDDLGFLRGRARVMSAQAGRITRRGQEPAPVWKVERWPVTVADVLAGGAERYAESVEAWARSIVDATEGAELQG